MTRSSASSASSGSHPASTQRYVSQARHSKAPTERGSKERIGLERFRRPLPMNQAVGTPSIDVIRLKAS
jgi:hypothetical protein